MSRLQFCLPVFLGIHRNPQQKDFFQFARGIFKDNPIYPLLSTWITLRHILDKKPKWHFLSTALQREAFGPKKLKFHPGVKK